MNFLEIYKQIDHFLHTNSLIKQVIHFQHKQLKEIFAKSKEYWYIWLLGDVLNMKIERLGKINLLASRIGLGTAEIGLAYGLGDRPLPSESEAIGLLKQAVDLGVTFFDTANYYGLAEERIGKSGILRNSNVIVETKCAQFLEKGEYFSPSELAVKIRSQVDDSLTKLRIETLPILMLHGPNQEQIKKGERSRKINQ